MPAFLGKDKKYSTTDKNEVNFLSQVNVKKNNHLSKRN